MEFNTCKLDVLVGANITQLQHQKMTSSITSKVAYSDRISPRANREVDFRRRRSHLLKEESRECVPTGSVV
jgi:hypothetical protein